MGCKAKKIHQPSEWITGKEVLDVIYIADLCYMDLEESHNCPKMRPVSQQVNYSLILLISECVQVNVGVIFYQSAINVEAFLKF